MGGAGLILTDSAVFRFWFEQNNANENGVIFCLLLVMVKPLI